ncbi:MAG: response regulator [Gaiellaceae bacterium]
MGSSVATQDKTLRVLLVDDHQLVREGLRLLVDRAAGFIAVGEAADGDEALRLAERRMPEFILLDVALPGVSGIELIPKLIEILPDVKILMLSMEDDPAYVREAFKAGARGYVLKEAAQSELITAMDEIAKGGSYVHPKLGARLAQDESAGVERESGDPLSPRECEVLRLLALGHTNQEIAKLLFISVRTAETHRAHIMKKLDLSSRAELVRYALANDLLQAN